MGAEFLNNIKRFNPTLFAEYNKYRKEMINILITQMSVKEEQRFVGLSILEKQRIVADLHAEYENKSFDEMYVGLSEYFGLNDTPTSTDTPSIRF